MARRRYELTDEEWSIIEPLPLAVPHWLTVGGDA